MTETVKAGRAGSFPAPVKSRKGISKKGWCIMKKYKKLKGFYVPVIRFGFEIEKSFPTWKAARRFMKMNGISKCRAIYA